MTHRNRDFEKLQGQLHALQNEERDATLIHQALLKQINSQGDPEWLEMVLMKGLGVAPEGQIKVLFTEAIMETRVWK